MDHFQLIYAHKARQYHRMIEAEDVDGNLRKALCGITAWENKTVIDLGSGTGRFPLLFKEIPMKFTCLDLNRAMLLENKQQRELSASSWHLVQADMRSLPFPAGRTDIVIAGWAIGHLRTWYAEDWQRQIDSILLEMQRAARSGGTLIICETMSTGSLTPRPPVPELGEYYTRLEQRWQMQRQVIQTDYKFASVEQAVEYTEFFFGSELAEEIRLRGWARLPEWTGIWHCQT